MSTQIGSTWIGSIRIRSTKIGSTWNPLGVALLQVLKKHTIFLEENTPEVQKQVKKGALARKVKPKRHVCLKASNYGRHGQSELADIATSKHTNNIEAAIQEDGITC